MNILLSFFLGVLFSLPVFVLFLLLLSFLTGKIIKKRRNTLRKEPAFTVGTMCTVSWLNSIVQRVFLIAVTKKSLTFIIKSAIPKITEKTPLTSLEFNEIEIKEVPPEISQAIITETKFSEFVTLKCFYKPEMVISALSTVSVSILPSFNLEIDAKLNQIDADIALGIPESKGDAYIQMQNSTSVNFDVGASVKFVSINTEYLGPVWTSLREAVNYIIRSIKIKIPLEQALTNEEEEEKEEEEAKEEEKKQLPRNDSTHEVIEIHPVPVKSDVKVIIDPIFKSYQL